MRCVGKEFDGVVPDRMGRKPLGLFLAKDFGVAPITSGYLWVVSVFFRRLQRDPAYEVLVVFDRSRSVDASGEELCSFCIRTLEYDGKMSVVDPSSLPIYFRLHCCKPWVAEDGCYALALVSTTLRYRLFVFL